MSTLSSSGVTSVNYSPDGHYLASGSYDSIIKIWEVETGKELRTLSSYGVASVNFSPDGHYLASGKFGNTIEIWRVGR